MNIIGFNLKLYKKAQVEIKDKILQYKKELEIARAKGDQKGEKALLTIIKKLIAGDSKDLEYGYGVIDHGPFHSPRGHMKSPSFGLFDTDDERATFVPTKARKWQPRE
ncbi:MAG: hypothetical protein M0R32_09310 [Candidatus Cloacimonetes bacterium]|jgi:hypothetical protein|nr:hypothetical protein [Candidatus Cloacimonadota bacterium]